MKKFEQQDGNEEDGVGVVLQHYIGVDNGMKQDPLVLLERLKRLDTKRFILGKVCVVQSNYGRHIQTEGLFLYYIITY